jgi:hypothetical protein
MTATATKNTKSTPAKTDDKAVAAPATPTKAAESKQIDALLDSLTPTATTMPARSRTANRQDNSKAEAWITDSWAGRKGEDKYGTALGITVPDESAVSKLKSRLNRAAGACELGVTISTENVNGGIRVVFAAKQRTKRARKES